MIQDDIIKNVIYLFIMFLLLYKIQIKKPSYEYEGFMDNIIFYFICPKIASIEAPWTIPSLIIYPVAIGMINQVAIKPISVRTMV